MGNTYANVTVVDTTVDDVVRALGSAEALVAGGDGAVVVFAAADEHDGFSAGITARMLSTALERPALEVAVFDDDLLQYQLFVDGELVDEAAVPEDVAAEMVDESAGEVIPVSSPDRLIAALGRGSLVAVVRGARHRRPGLRERAPRAPRRRPRPAHLGRGLGLPYLDEDPDELPVPVIRTPA